MVALLAFGRSVAVASEAHGMARLQKSTHGPAFWTLSMILRMDAVSFSEVRAHHVGTGRLQAWGTAARTSFLHSRLLTEPPVTATVKVLLASLYYK